MNRDILSQEELENAVTDIRNILIKVIYTHISQLIYNDKFLDKKETQKTISKIAHK